MNSITPTKMSKCVLYKMLLSENVAQHRIFAERCSSVSCYSLWWVITQPAKLTHRKQFLASNLTFAYTKMHHYHIDARPYSLFIIHGRYWLFIISSCSVPNCTTTKINTPLNFSTSNDIHKFSLIAINMPVASHLMLFKEFWKTGIFLCKYLNIPRKPLTRNSFDIK